jgi:hypothetical protein
VFCGGELPNAGAPGHAARLASSRGRLEANPGVNSHLVAQPKRYPEDDADALWRLFEAVPSQFKAEIIDGTLHVNPRPSSDHQVANGALTAFIGVPYMYRGDAGGPDGWWIVPVSLPSTQST